MKKFTKSIFRNIPRDQPVLLAVSGGSDSMALLLLANIWSLENNVLLQAVTVDHGLRAEAAAEASFVASVCAGLDIPHVTLAWDGIKPNYGLQEAARNSRYSLMDDYAHEIGADVILTGHTSDDQAETVLMRLSREGAQGDGRGLSGMASKTWLYGGTRIYRPLLGISREALREVLKEFSQPWVEDPTNLDTSYERVRARNLLSVQPKLKSDIFRFSDACGRLRSLMANACAIHLAQNAQMLPGPVFELSVSKKQSSNALDAEPVTTVIEEQSIQAILSLAGGQQYLVSRRRLKPVLELLYGPNGEKVTLGGAVVEKTTRGLRFYREYRNLSSILVDPGEAAIWDGRLHIYNETEMPVFIAAPSKAQIKELESKIGKPLAVKPRQALWSTPALHFQSRNDGKTLDLPLVTSKPLPRGLEVRLASPAIEHFCPEFDAPIRDWVRNLDQYPAASLQP